MAELNVKEEKVGGYKIKVKIEIEEYSNSEPGDPIKKEDGYFERNITEGQAISIDKCEKALLETNSEAIRDAISRHLTELSKKKHWNKGVKKS